MEKTSVIAWAYPLELESDDNGTWLITAPDLPELTSWAPIDRLEETIRNARNALVAALAARIERGEDIPAPSPARGRLSVVAPTLVGLKIALYRVMRAQGISQKELARRLDCDPKEVRRLLDVTHGSRADMLDRALMAVGVQPPSSAIALHAGERDGSSDRTIERVAMQGAEINALLGFARRHKEKFRA
jgi:antitoxin HicB